MENLAKNTEVESKVGGEDRDDQNLHTVRTFPLKTFFIFSLEGENFSIKRLFFNLFHAKVMMLDSQTGAWVEWHPMRTKR